MANQTPEAPVVYFTGDFAEAGASAPCRGSAITTAQRQILDVINSDWLALRARMPGAKLMGCLGNHDSAPGDVFYGTEEQGWQYKNLTALWGPDLQHDQASLATVLAGGYYSTRPLPGLTVIGLNVNCTSVGVVEYDTLPDTWVDVARTPPNKNHPLGMELFENVLC